MTDSVEMHPVDARLGWVRPELLRSWGEFIIAAALVMALPIRSSTSAALQGSSGHFVQLLLTNRHVIGSICMESVLLAAFLLYLAWRGWKPADFHMGLSWSTSAQGVGLLFLAYGAAFVTGLVLVMLIFLLEGPENPVFKNLTGLVAALRPHTIQVGWLAIFVWVIVNAFLEELVCMGYIFNQLAARRGPRVALAGTVFLRVACHTYQDPVHLAGIAALFSTFAVWYWVGRKLWPLIFAHILLDLVSISMIKIWFG